MRRPLRQPGVDACDVDGELVIWDGALLHLLDSQAAAVWGLLDGDRTPDDVVDALVEGFAVDGAVLRRDVTALLASLRERGLVVDQSESEGDR